MTGNSSLERKLKREIASRKAAELLLEQKSYELYESTQKLSVALKKLELRSESDLRKFEFEEKIDATLIRFGRTFLSSTFDETMIASFLEQLTSNSVITASYLYLDPVQLTSLRRHHFGHLDLKSDKPIARTPNWQNEALHLPIIIDERVVGELIFSVSLEQIEQAFISKQMELVSDLVHGVISRHLSLEREVELRKRAEESEKATKEFVAMINHELRTPLNGVLGSADLLSKTQLGEDQRQYLGNLIQSGDLLRVIINDLLDFSKMNAGMMEIIDKVFAWDDLEKAITGVFAAKAAEKRIHFSIDKKLGIPEFLIGDLERITQILVNLIGVSIPLKEGQAQGAASGELAVVERSDLAGRSILVVDDIRMNQVIVTQMLKKLDITPDLKANGLEALEAVKNKDYELIFMDCRMPEMDGYEATAHLRQKGFDRPIIALTAGTTIEERQKCIDSGMDDILTKPYTATDIEQIMCKWLEQ
ncbi:response regulator [Vibrio parahaemolyticus]|nr:response regulator [Vibrio parahaemolyticus]